MAGPPVISDPACGSAESLIDQAIARLHEGDRPAAERLFEAASASDDPEVLLRLAEVAMAGNYGSQAIAVLDKAVALCPTRLNLCIVRVRMQIEAGRLGDARAGLDDIGRIAPEHRAARFLGALLHGRLGDARAQTETLDALLATAAAADPGCLALLAVRAMGALHDAELAPDEVAERHRAAGQALAGSMAPPPAMAVHRRARPRIGYLSGDLYRQHPVGLFLLPILQHHDRQAFEIVVYRTGGHNDAVTAAARQRVDRWVEAGGLDDEALLRQIRHDGIDLLVDLGGWTASNRLGVLARRAAPVQASYLGYPHGTGVPTIDWLIGDAVVVPRDSPSAAGARVWPLPGCVFCFTPLEDFPLPEARRGDAPLVFGSFNATTKLGPETIALWSRVLAAVPDSRLLLKAPALADPWVCRYFQDAFGVHGIDPGRIQLCGPSELAGMMQAYGDIDVALDPFPYNGGTTTLQALWMGVPVVTLRGRHFAGRMGASFLHAIGADAWIADDEAQYVAIATGLAAGSAAIRAGRSALRARLSASAAGNIHAHVRDLENAYRAMLA